MYTDIDECEEATSNCSQMCTNVIGGYNCSCRPGYELSTDSFTCDLNGTRVIIPLHVCIHAYHILIAVAAGCSISPCDAGMCIREMSGEYHCVCELGQMCAGDCSGVNEIALANGQQSCKGNTEIVVLTSVSHTDHVP